MGGLKVFSSPSAVIERVGSACGLSEFIIIAPFFLSIFECEKRQEQIKILNTYLRRTHRPIGHGIASMRHACADNRDVSCVVGGAQLPK